MKSRDIAKAFAPLPAKDLAIFRSKFDNLPRIIGQWCGPFCVLAGKRILDFGCGEGTTALGMALTHAPALVVGTDINREHKQCRKLALRAEGINTLPENLKFEEITRGEISNESDFDLIYSWSVFEHIDQRLFSGIIDALRTKLRPNALLFVQIAPLYYSAEGSHLWDVGFGNWEHLTDQIDQIHRVLYNTLPRSRADNLWNTFSTLNKITAPKLIREVIGHGFELLKEYRTSVQFEPPEDLLLAYSKDALITEQVVALFRRV